MRGVSATPTEPGASPTRAFRDPDAVSPPQKELQNKYEIYEESGVREYWIVSPQNETFFKYTLAADGKFQASHLMTIGDKVTTAILPGFVLDLASLFEGN